MRTKSDTRRQAILDTAQAMFEEKGFEQTSMAEIAAQLGGSKATLYSYFSSKDTLLLELVKRCADQHIAQVMALLDPAEDVEVTLRLFGRRALEIFQSAHMIGMRRMIIAASTRSDVGKMFYQHGPARGMKLLEDYLAAEIAAGKLRPADPRIAAQHLRGLLDADLFESGLLNARAELTATQISNIVDQAMRVFMAAYGPGFDSAQSTGAV